jgi:hypothetical protein
VTTGLALEHAQEVAFAHRRASRECRDREVLVRLLDDPRLQLREHRPVGRLRLQLRAELRLATGAAHEHHEPAGHVEREVAAVVVVDERERKIDAGRDAGAREDVAVAHVDGIGLDGDLREEARERVALAPVRGRAPAVEQARGGEHERAGADTGDPARGARPASQRAEESFVARRGRRALATGDDQRVDRAAQLVECPRRDERQPARRPLGSRRGGDDLDVVTTAPGALAGEAVREREHLERPGHVEQLHVVVGDDHDPPTTHRSILPHRLHGDNAIVQSHPATTTACLSEMALSCAKSLSRVGSPSALGKRNRPSDLGRDFRRPRRDHAPPVPQDDEV